jgi:hypothetical protein
VCGVKLSGSCYRCGQPLGATKSKFEALMSIFTTPLSQLAEGDLQLLLTDRAVENLQLEFKREVPDKEETLKKLSAFANTIGGLMVVGAAADKDGRITALGGVDGQSSYKQTIVQWCFDGVSPPIAVEVSEEIALTSAAGRVCYVIRVRESDLGPHFINGRKGVYVRSDEFSSRFKAQLANDNELRQLFNRREIVRGRRSNLIRRSRERFATFTSQKYGELGEKRQGGIGARFDLSIGPQFPAHEICSQEKLVSIIPTKRISWRQVGFPRSPDELLSQHESVISLRPSATFSILEANTWGMLFYATEVEFQPRPHALDEPGIHSLHFAGSLLAFLQHAGVILREIGYVGPLGLEMKLDAIRGVPWLMFDGAWSSTGPASQLDDSAAFSIETTTDELTSARDALAISLLRLVFYATGMTAAVDKAGLEHYLKGGYKYNMWDPTHLRV